MARPINITQWLSDDGSMPDTEREADEHTREDNLRMFLEKTVDLTNDFGETTDASVAAQIVGWWPEISKIMKGA